MKLTKMAALMATTMAIAAPGAAMLSTPAAADDMPTVTLMVGGIDKQIYLPYQLAESLGMYKKYGVNVELSTEQAGGVGAEDAMLSGQVDMAGAWYNHTIELQEKGKNVLDVIQLSVAPGERIMCAKGTDVKSPADWKGKAVGVTDLGSGTDALVSYVSARAGPGAHRLHQDRGRRRPDHDRRAEVRQGDLRHHQPADGECDREA